MNVFLIFEFLMESNFCLVGRHGFHGLFVAFCVAWHLQFNKTILDLNPWFLFDQKRSWFFHVATRQTIFEKWANLPPLKSFESPHKELQPFTTLKRLPGKNFLLSLCELWSIIPDIVEAGCSWQTVEDDHGEEIQECIGSCREYPREMRVAEFMVNFFL